MNGWDRPDGAVSVSSTSGSLVEQPDSATAIAHMAASRTVFVVAIGYYNSLSGCFAWDSGVP
ncbi:hypothetical protein SBD_5839 [Streptomyces bottropensis ATCC 25435]|uniref:Uncharacterized protein n=1 Tax=Streptomyces bottropensis ATCC 25435 TaxID=1054862 RepID=M3FL18_9ACTN|nr:hypothetical protein SBD_5839 [Streptomyces bottropensis ATCC 25435]